MTYHSHDDLPDDPPSLPGHDPIVRSLGRIGLSPAEVTVTCSCGWTFESQESIGGGVEPWGEYWEDHLAGVAADDPDTADCGDSEVAA